MAVSLGALRGLARSETAPFAKLRSIRLSTTAAAPKPTTEPRCMKKPRHVSPKVQTFLGGVSENPKNKANKRFWAYIKNQIRQDRNVQKIIICDEKLKKLPLVQGIVTVLG